VENIAVDRIIDQFATLSTLLHKLFFTKVK